jgi:spore germination protein YaaH
MDETIVGHLSASPVGTVALFSVTTTAAGLVDTTKPGYKKIAGAIGRSIVDAVHERGGRIDLVFSSFGSARNKSFFRKPAVQAAAITSLLDVARKVGADGLALDVEQLDPSLLGAYGEFVARLRTALFAAMPAARLTVATGASATGAAIAAAAIAASADRVFLMGYDYRVAGSDPGATAPLRRADGGHDLAWSLDTYAALGVPPQRTLLGLPLYGMAWPVAGPGLGAPATGPGAAWIPADHADFLAASAAKAVTDDEESVDVYFVASDGSVGVPDATASPSPAAALTWKAIYVDSPATLMRKLALGQEYGLAGAGFWAMGYERGLPGYSEMLSAYLKGAVLSAN